MRHVSFIVVVVSLCVAGVTFGGMKAGPKGISIPTNGASDRFDPQQSAAFFVGVREFSHDSTLAMVPYAVDDAVDLAYAMSSGPAPLVNPSRVVLALSGEPQKSRSRITLDALLAAGAVRHDATQPDIVRDLQAQARAAGRNGLLIVSFATHGVSEDGTQYLFASTSMLEYPETSLRESTVREIASHTDAARALILLDACRQRLTRNGREGEPDPRSAAALIRGMTGVNGQVIFSAAAAGDYAYDDDKTQNGVFTSAVIEGMKCHANTDENGFVTVEKLAEYVEETVLTWVRKHRDPKANRATQLNSEGRSRKMPLAVCTKRTQ